MVISLTIGWGVALLLAGALLWAGLMLWPSRRPASGDLMGIGGMISGLARFAAGLIGTILLLVLYIVLKIGLGV